MSAENEKIVREFCRAWSRRDAEELLGYFSDDAVYHNVPLEAVQGKEAIRQVFGMFLPPSERIEWEVLALASSGDLVFTERVDSFVMGGKRIDLPVAGVFELREGRITAWRDYFDMGSWTRQLGA